MRGNREAVNRHDQNWVDDTHNLKLDIDSLANINRLVHHLPEQHMDRADRQTLSDIAHQMADHLSPVEMPPVVNFESFHGNPLAVALGFFYDTSSHQTAEYIQNVIDGGNPQIRVDLHSGLNNKNDGVVATNNYQSVVSISENSTTDDIFIAIHELAHTIDLDTRTPDGNNRTRHLLGEVAPIAYEMIASHVLMKNQAIAPHDSQLKQRLMAATLYHDTVESYIRLELVSLQRSSWSNSIETRDIISVVDSLGINATQARELAMRLNHHVQVGYQPHRYMIANLLVPTIVDEYQQDSSSISKLEQFQQCVKNNQFDNALTTLSITANEQGIDELITNINAFNRATVQSQ